MKKILILIGIGMFYLLSVCVYAYNPNDEDVNIGKSDWYLIGSINNKYPIQMQLFRNSNDKIEGVYFYESVNEPIALSGTLKNGYLILDEKDSRGKITAVFEGKLVDNNLYSGIWRSKASQKQFPFRVEPITPKTCTWRGKWERIGYYYSPTSLSIEELGQGSIKFGISANSGGEMREIEGVAKIDGNIAYYKDKATGAKIIFKNHGNVIEIATNEAAAGLAVGFDGIFRQGLKKKAPTLYDLGNFDSMTQDQMFHQLVKGDYDSFSLNLHVPDYRDDIDHFKAKVISGFVRGCPSMRAIIMYTADNRFWAAVTKDEGINYYTNTKMKTVPKTIQAWVKTVAENYGKTNIHWVK